MLTGVSTWALKTYVGFQFNKSAIKKLYSYSRIKQTKVKKDDADDVVADINKKDFQEDQENAGASSLNVDVDIEGLQDNEDEIKDKVDEEDLNAEVAILESMPYDHKATLFGATVKSKQTLNFGYGAFSRMRYYQCIVDCCSCCTKKKDTAKARQKWNIANKNLRRNAIGRAKKAQEFDIINIVDQLRVSNFLASVYLKPYQQQLIKHFKNYSLDQTRLFNNDWKPYKRNELIEKITNAKDDDSWEAKVNKKIL